MLTLERSSKGWLLTSTDYSRIVRLTSKQVRELFIKLNSENFDDAYLSKANPKNLIIVIDDDFLLIKNYVEIKNRPYVREIKTKVNKTLLKRMVRNVNHKLKGKKIKIVAATLSLATVITIMVAKINDIEPQPNILETSVSEYQDEEFDDYAFVEDPTFDDIIAE